MKVYLAEISGGVATLLLGEREPVAIRVPVESLQGFSRGEPVLRQAMDRDPATRVEPQGRPKVDFEADGYRCRVVGSRLYRRPTHETFHEFIMRLLYWKLGTRWYDSEMKKPLDEQHQVVRWYACLRKWATEGRTSANVVPGGHQIPVSGEVQSLLSLAYDVYQMLHSAELPKRVIRRLRDRHTFQGARYEIAIASVFVRLRWKVWWYPGRSTGASHPEFIAVHPPTGAAIAVEAKSRHRPGVLGYPGQAQAVEPTVREVRYLIAEALNQRHRGIPFAVFVDLNAPHESMPPIRDVWLPRLIEMMKGFGVPSAFHPDAFNAIFITSFPYHYAGNSLSPGARHMFITSAHPQHPFSFQLLQEIATGLDTYGILPDGMY